MVKSHMWSQRAQGLEDFLRYLIEMQPAELMNQLKTEKEFQILIDCVVHKLENETVIKIIEISLDLLELLLSSLPECLFQNITQVILCFLKQLSNRRDMISDKANDLINLARETLGADFLLPHFVSILNGMAEESQQMKTKIFELSPTRLISWKILTFSLVVSLRTLIGTMSLLQVVLFWRVFSVVQIF